MERDQKQSRPSTEKPGIAPGVENLEQSATPSDLATGNRQRVTKLIYEELEQSDR